MMPASRMRRPSMDIEKAMPWRMTRAIRAGCGAVNASPCTYPLCKCVVVPKAALAAIAFWEASPDHSELPPSEAKP